MASVLTTDYYIIRSIDVKDGGYVGRSQNEDKSLLPKQVISLPSGVEAPKWVIERLPNGRYRFKIGGASTGVKDELVFAFLLENETPVDWVITHVPHVGEHIYAVTREEGDGCVLPDTKPYTQIACRFFPVGKSQPPTYPTNALWSIVRVPPS